MFGPKYLVLLPFTSDKPLVAEFAQCYMKSKSVSTAMKTRGAINKSEKWITRAKTKIVCTVEDSSLPKCKMSWKSESEK